MANKKQTVTLQLDLDLPKGKIKEFGEMLNKSISLDNNKGKEFLDNINKTVKISTTEASKLIKMLNRPVKSSSMAKQLGDSLERSFNTLDNKLFSLQGALARTFNSQENQQIIKDYQEISNLLDKMNKDYKKVTDLNAEKNALGSKSSISKEINAANKELKALEKNKKHLSNAEAQRYKELDGLIESNNQKLRQKEEITAKIEKIHLRNKVSNQSSFKDKIRAVTDNQNKIGSGMFSEADLNTLNTLLNQYRVGVKLVTKDLTDLGERGETSWNEINEGQIKSAKTVKTFSDIFKGLGLGFSVQQIARAFKQLAKYSFDFYKKLDKSLTNISIVSRKTRDEVQSLTTDFINMAQQTGMSIDDIAQGAVIFFQQGLSDEEALKMTEISAEFAKVADITVESASDKLTAAVHGYNMAVSDAARVADKLNVLAADSAASIDELATAMEKGASMAHQSGLSFDQYNAILATMIEVTREAPENIGTSMKTIMARFQQIKKAGTTEDGETDVNAVETALKSVGVQLRDSEGILRDLGDVLGDLGPKWQSLDRNTQAYLGTVIAGTRQQSRFVSLMQNWDRAMELTTASEQSAGAQALQHQLAMEGLEASINNLTIAWQHFLTKLTSSDMFKHILDSLTHIMNIVTTFKGLVPKLGIIYGLVKIKQKLDSIEKDLADNKDVHKTVLYKINQMLKESIKLTDEERIKIKTFKLELQKNPIKALSNKPFAGLDAFLIRTKMSLSAIWVILKTKIKTAIVSIGKSIKDIVKTMATKNPLVLISMITTIGSMVGNLLDSLIFNGERKLEKANKKLKEDLDDMEISMGTENIINSNLNTYKELSNAINLTTTEQEKLNNATEALAENVKEAVIGYDAMGHAILDINKIEEAKLKAKKNKENAAGHIIGDIGTNLAADFEARGEANYQDIWYRSTGTRGALAGAAAGALIGTYVVPIVGTIIGALVGSLAGAAGGSAIGAAGAKAEENRLARKEYVKVLSEHEEEMIKAIDTLTKAFISFDKDIYDKNGRLKATKEEKQEVVSRMQSQFLRDQTTAIGNKVVEGDIDADEAAEELEKLTGIWETTLASIGDQGINQIVGQAMAMKGLVDNKNKTWAEIKQQMEDTLAGLNIPEEAKESIEEAFKASVYSGTSKGVYTAMQDIKRQQEAESTKEQWEQETGGTKWWNITTWGGPSYDKWKEDKAKEYQKYFDMINNIDPRTLSAYGNLGITKNKDFAQFFNKNYSGDISKAAKTGDETDVTMAGLSSLYKAQDEIESRMGALVDTTSEEYKRLESMSLAVEQSIEQAWSNLPMSVEPTWEQLFQMYDEFTERTKVIRDTLGEIEKDGGITYDQFKDLTTLFDNIDTSALSGEQLTAYGNSLSIIADNLELVNGEFQLNKTALQEVGNLEEQLATAQVEGVRKKLLAKQAELGAQKDMLVADRSYMQAQLEVAKSVVNGNYKEQEATAKLDEAKRNFTSNASRLLRTYMDNEYMAANTYQKTWNTAFNEVADKYNQLLTARITGHKADINVNKELEKYASDMKTTTEDLYDFSKMNKGEAQEAVDELEKAIAAADHTIGEYDKSLGNIDLKLKTLDSGIRLTTDDFGKGSKAVKEYVSKLEEFLDLLRHIEREEANLKFAKKLEEMQTGVSVLNRLGDELRYVNCLIGDMNTLYQNYEKKASDAAAEIRKGFGDLISFNKWGNYAVDLDAYHKMSGEEQEKLDKLLEEYKKLVEARDKYYGSYLNYTQEQLKINQKYVDKYIEGENTLVEAIKKREKDIFDNKMAAVDKEIKAINKVAEARRKAREVEEEGQELSGMQTDLQRALMDSSGASAIDILDIQKQIEDKQQDIADKNFDTMVEDMTTELENEKALEQKLFNERLEEMDWYWDEVDRIMGEGTDSILETMQLYMDKFNQGSELQQTELLKGWENTFIQAVKIGKLGAQSYQKIVSDLQANINGLVVDEDVLTEGAVNTGFEKRPEIAKKNTGNGGKASKSYAYGGKTTVEPKVTIDPEPEMCLLTFISGDSESFTKECKLGSTISMPVRSKKGYRFDGWSSTSGICIPGNGTYKVRGDEIFTAIWVRLHEDRKEYYKGANRNIRPSYPSRRDYYSGSRRGFSYTNRGRYPAYASGGMNYSSGLAWLDGTKTNPEAVLDSIQTKAFLQFTDDLSKIRHEDITKNNNNIVIDNISFNVDNMSSVADGEKAFDAFVNKFKEIGGKQGISILGTSNRN